MGAAQAEQMKQEGMRFAQRRCDDKLGELQVVVWCSGVLVF
jgi:hypothetical protein